MLGEKETYKYQEILEADTIKQMEMKEKIKKRVSQEKGKQIETKLYSRNLIKGINALAFSFSDRRDHFWRGQGKIFNKWTREQENSWRCIRFYIPKDDEGWIEYTSIEDSVDA